MFGISKRTYFVGSVEMVVMEAILYSLSSELKSPSYSLAGSSFNTKGVFFFFSLINLYCIFGYIGAILAANLCFDLWLNLQHPSQDEFESLLYCNSCAVN